MSAQNMLVFGCGVLGVAVARRLVEHDHKVLMVDNDAALVEKAQEQNLDARLADYENDDVLRELGIGSHCESVFCMFEKDARNVFLCISAKNIDRNLNIVSVSHAGTTDPILREAGASKVIDPYESTAYKIRELIHRPLIAELFERTVFGQADMYAEELRIPENSPVCGWELSRFGSEDSFGLVILGILDRELGNQLMFTTEGRQHVLDPGDILVVLGDRSGIDNFRKFIAAPK